jgi:hypothetical protein
MRTLRLVVSAMPSSSVRGSGQEKSPGVDPEASLPAIVSGDDPMKGYRRCCPLARPGDPALVS